MTHEEYALQCERNGNLKENYVYVARERDRLKEENEELRRQVREAVPARHGKWSDKMLAYRAKSDVPEHGDFHFGFRCSECRAILNKTKFCGNCGAKMDGGAKT